MQTKPGPEGPMRTWGSLSWLRRLGAVALLLAVSFGSAYVALTPKAQARSPAQVAFDHKAMVEAGMACLYCHGGALKSPVAGIPSLESCMGCHKLIEIDSPQILELASYWERQEPIRWARVNRLPRFVYFSHQVHVVAAGLNCERCHGDVGQMTLARPVVDMNMGWCLGCHEQQPNAEQLRDCIICHQ